MEQIIKIKIEYNSLNALNDFLKKETDFECSIDYDKWDVRTDSKGQMEQCIIVKKNAMNAIKLFFTEENAVKVNHVIPSPVMNAYFGKSQKARRNIIEIVTGLITQAILASPQQKAFEELETIIRKAGE